jgi:ergothioneine biosynthesis protein EgtB
MTPLLERELDASVRDLVELGLHHEQQHQELLLMDIKHVLSVNPLRPAYRAAAHETSPTKPLRWIAHDGGLVEAGASGDGFTFDNELPRHRVWLEPFELADRLVTCGEWLEFMADDGYHRPELWLSDGWATICREGWEAPLYWEATNGWQVFTLGGMRPVDPGDPVRHVSYYEADAFARWAGARLPTEVEWEIVAPSRCREVFDEAWQWTATDYAPYPGFAPAPGAVGEYNGKFMVSQHVLRGGSALTPSGHSRPTYRNFFPPSARWVMSGVRLAR